jgi:protein kinase A
LKPENILIDRDGYIKLTDFGLAKDASTLCYSFCGTPEYLAPEVISEQGHATPVDLWTLGCFIFEMSFGYPPFRSNNKKDLYQQIQKVLLANTSSQPCSFPSVLNQSA